jgi:riboflavin transporter FmnP
MQGLLDTIQKNIEFVGISLLLMIGVFAIARGSEVLIEKKTDVKFTSEKTKVNKTVIMAMLSAIAVILMYFDFPIPFIAPGFYKIDFSEIPVLIGSFMLGPCAGVIIEAVKVILHFCMKGTTTAFVGDFANFILGCMYVVPPAIIYHTKKTRKMAMISLIAGGVILVIAGMLLNAWYLLPKYSELYGIPLDVLIAMGTKVNASITDVFSFVALAVAPFNIIKALIDGIVTVILYKYLSHQLKA